MDVILIVPFGIGFIFIYLLIKFFIEELRMGLSLRSLDAISMVRVDEDSIIVLEGVNVEFGHLVAYSYFMWHDFVFRSERAINSTRINVKDIAGEYILMIR